jgi:hypothetical protein
VQFDCAQAAGAAPEHTEHVITEKSTQQIQSAEHRPDLRQRRL